MIFNKKILCIFLLAVLLPTNLTTASIQQSSTSAKNYENVAKVHDYVEYSFTTTTYTQTGEPLYFNTPQHGTLRWTVTAVNGKNISLTVTVHVGTFYSDQKDIIVSNRTAYTQNFKELGYIPFWIPLDQLTANPSMNISLGGTLNKPLLGTVLKPNYEWPFLGGMHSVVWLTNPNNYYYPHMTGGSTVGGYTWYFSKSTGLLALMGLGEVPVIWWTLQFTYSFTGVMTVSATNLNFGPLDIFTTIVYYLVPFIIPLAIIAIVLIFLVIWYIMKRIRNRH